MADTTLLFAQKGQRVLSPEQLANVLELAEELEKNPWHVAVSRDKRKAQIVDARGGSVFGGSWTLSPEEAEKIVAVRKIFPILFKSLVLSEKTLAELSKNLVGFKEVFTALTNYEEISVWARKGLQLLEAIDE